MPRTMGIRHVALNVRDLAAAERFYVDVVGIKVEWHPNPENLYLTSGADNLALHQARSTDPWDSPGHLDHVGFVLPAPSDVDAWAEHFRARGIPLLQEPKTHRDGARSLYLRDPDGNTLQFIFHPPISHK